LTSGDTGQETSPGLAHVPTSAALEQLLLNMPGDTVNLSWLLRQLGERSFGFLMLIAALIGLIPGIATAATLVMPILAFQMLLGRKTPSLPRFLADRPISSDRFYRAIARLVPYFRRVEMIVRPRWRTPFETIRRFIGALILLLAVTTLAPFPFYQIPTLAILLIAFAYLEEDGLLLCISLVAAVLSIAFTAGTILVTLKAFAFIARLWSRF
jgi:hypothetical protein